MSPKLRENMLETLKKYPCGMSPWFGGKFKWATFKWPVPPTNAHTHTPYGKQTSCVFAQSEWYPFPIPSLTPEERWAVLWQTPAQDTATN